MNGATVFWSENIPSGTESMNSGDDRMRSLKTDLRTGLDDEHTFPAAGGLAGYHRYGAARAYFGPQSNVSSSGTEGRIMVTSDTSRLFGVGSGGTVFLGSATALSMGTFGQNKVSPPQRAHWVQEGEFLGRQTDLTGYATVTFPNSGYSGAPVVIISSAIVSGLWTPPDGNPVMAMLSAHSITKTEFVARSLTSNGVAVASVPFCWLSVGTRTL